LPFPVSPKGMYLFHWHKITESVIGRQAFSYRVGESRQWSWEA
jgi:hypothetical protein